MFLPSCNGIPSEASREANEMKYFTHASIAAFIPAVAYLASPETADAGFNEGTGGAALKVIVAVLVGGLFAYNHYKSRINTFIKNLFSREEKGTRTGGQ